MKTLFGSMLAAGALVFGSQSVAGAPEHAHVMMQGGGGIYAEDGAILVRQPGGIAAGMRVPTPASGSYDYPAGRVAGHPEIFTVWAFVFNFPALCDGPCDGNDIGATLAQGGAYNIGGHAVGAGLYLDISGRIGVGDTPFSGVPLINPEGAEVHVALAPHGALNPETLPTEFRSPTGPGAFWWVGVFLPDE